MYKVSFIENPNTEYEVNTYLGCVESEYLYDVYMFIADFAHEYGWINCFMIPYPDEENDCLTYVYILTTPHYFVIENLLN